MVAVVVFEFSGMRCQPLRRALCLCIGSVEIIEVWNDISFDRITWYPNRFVSW